LIVLLFWLVLRTDVGRAWRALTQNPLGAQVVGVNVLRFSSLAFAASGALVGAAGALLLPLYFVYPTAGDGVLVKSYIVVVLGGMGSISGSLVGGIALGLVEAFGSTFIGPTFTDAYGFLFMVLILLLRPQGLFGREVRAL
jgi:branched-chain amino acid transport system permease protein